MTATNSSLNMTKNLSQTTNPNDFDDIASSGKLKTYRKVHNYVHIFAHYLIINTNEQTKERNAFSLTLCFLFSCPLWQLYVKKCKK